MFGIVRMCLICPPLIKSHDCGGDQSLLCLTEDQCVACPGVSVGWRLCIFCWFAGVHACSAVGMAQRWEQRNK